MDQLLFDGEGSGGVLNCPVLLIQVTRLLCGGFIFALRLKHTICDAIGLAQFVSAVAELARGVPAPTVTPVWSRELLEARSPPKPALQYDAVLMPPPPGDLVMRTFTFGRADVSAIQRRLRDAATTFEALTAGLWRARTAAFELPPDDDVRLVILSSIRGVRELGLPARRVLRQRGAAPGGADHRWCARRRLDGRRGGAGAAGEGGGERRARAVHGRHAGAPPAAVRGAGEPVPRTTDTPGSTAWTSGGASRRTAAPRPGRSGIASSSPLRTATERTPWPCRSFCLS
ncbi:hypothetical protein ACP70R_048312 [Stipagrostis hirtigluma subsp. patula]